MKALVTGAAGFIGSNICERLLADGHTVIGVDSFTNYYDVSLKRKNIEIVENSKFTLIEGDLNNIDLKSLISDVEVIFHQAGQPGVRSSWGSEFSQYCDQNILATQRLLEAARSSDSLSRFVYASSSSIYGNAASYPTTEADLPRPLSPYGVSKLAGEHLCSLYGENFGVPTVSLRYFTVYGPRQRPDMAFTRFTKAAIQGTPITLYGDGEQIRDFTFVGDIVGANLLAASSSGVAPGSVLNVSGGSRVTVNQVIALLEEIADREILITREDRFPGDVLQTGGSSANAKELLGWQARVSLKEGLAAQYDWAKGILASSIGAR